jgi:hypothetical protein
MREKKKTARCAVAIHVAGDLVGADRAVFDKTRRDVAGILSDVGGVTQLVPESPAVYELHALCDLLLEIEPDVVRALSFTHSPNQHPNS